VLLNKLLNIPEKQQWTLTAVRPNTPLKQVKDARGHKIRGLWERNGRYYASLRHADRKSARMVPLVDEHSQPVQTAAQAVQAATVCKSSAAKAKHLPRASRHNLTNTVNITSTG